MQVLGKCIGARIVPRGKDDPHACIEILVEDDENWFTKVDFSSYWLDEAISVLSGAKEILENQHEKDPKGGYVLKVKKVAND